MTRRDKRNNSNRGAVYVLLLNANGTVKSSVKIASGTNGGPTLADYDYFGSSVASLGDLDGDGVTELAVGAFNDDTDGCRMWGSACAAAEYQRHGEEQRENCQRHQRRPHAREQ